MGATTAVSFCKYSAGGPNELGWARPSFSENPQNLYYPLGSSSTTAEMCKKTPWYQPACWIFFRPSLIFSARCARGGTPYIFFARFARGQTIDTPRFPKNLKVSVRPARKIFKNGREKKKEKNENKSGIFSVFSENKDLPCLQGFLQYCLHESAAVNLLIKENLKKYFQHMHSIN